MTKQQRSQFTPYVLPTRDAVLDVGWVSKGDLAKALYPEQTCDTALPQAWVNFMADLNLDVRPGWVMLYDPDNRRAIMGIPMPLYIEALTDMESKEHNVAKWTASRARELLAQMREDHDAR